MYMRETADGDQRQILLLGQIEEYARGVEEERGRQEQINVEYEIMREQEDVETRRLQERVD